MGTRHTRRPYAGKILVRWYAFEANRETELAYALARIIDELMSWAVPVDGSEVPLRDSKGVYVGSARLEND
jgi:hypothetical protein